LLSLQQPESAKKGKEAHEEHLFIVIHQSYELWFKQILHELDSVIDIFSQATLPERVMAIVVNRLERVSAVLKILVEQVAILETMNPLDFLEFRYRGLLRLPESCCNRRFFFPFFSSYK
jgi:tryptophan 2,3-dioxygenase